MKYIYIYIFLSLLSAYTHNRTLWLIILKYFRMRDVSQGNTTLYEELSVFLIGLKSGS